MLTVTSNYKTKNETIWTNPVYVAELIFAGGNRGTEGVNDIYFATCGANEITGVPYTSRWFPFLKPESVGSLSQSVDPVNGVSSIGSVDLALVDFQGMVSEIIRAADAAGHGLRRQRLVIYRLFKGADWVDRTILRTMQINDVKLNGSNEYRLTAADVQRQMQKTVFNPFMTKLTEATSASGGITAKVVDARNFIAVASVTYGTVGFIKIGSEIMQWSTKTDGYFTVGPSGRAMFGTVAEAHAIEDEVTEVIVLNENPITLALKILESTGVANTNGAWDKFPARWGCGMDSTNDVDEAGILLIGRMLTGLSSTPASSDGLQFEFVLDKGVEAKKFIEDSIFKIIGCFGFVRGDGKYSIKAYSDLSNADKENASAILNLNNVVKWGDLNYNYNDLANNVWMEFDEQPKLSGKYLRNTLFIDTISIKKWGEAKQLKYTAQGLIPTSLYSSQIYQRFQRIMARYSRPPMKIDLTLLPKMHLLEIGDVVRVNLPVRDLLTGLDLDRAFEVLSTRLNAGTGEVGITCIAQPERANFWFQGVGYAETVTISPSVASIPTGTTLQLVPRAFDASGTQVAIGAISWIATGNVTVSSTGLVTAGAVGSGSVYAVVGTKTSNTAAFTVTAAAYDGIVATVEAIPSTVQMQAGGTQQMTALAYDISGNMINGKTFTWTTSNAAAVSLPAGNAVSKIATAVANGTSHIIATENVSGIASTPAIVTVKVPETPQYSPPFLADSAYHIGTQITAHGPAGGPHIIPNGYNFTNGYYWYDGDVTLPAGSTCTINNSVRILSTGNITINGTVDGAGRGGMSAPGVYGTPQAAPGHAWFLGYNGNFSGLTSRGGNGAGVIVNGVTAAPAVGSAPIYASPPVLSITGTASNSAGSWTAITGLPSSIEGSHGGSGSVVGNGETSAAAGYAGAGLLLMARGIFITAGQINLNGLAGGNGAFNSSLDAQIYCFGGGGGGGGGGTFIALAERDINGLINMSVLASRINTAGGAAGVSWSGGWTDIPATAATAGAVITQIIG